LFRLQRELPMVRPTVSPPPLKCLLLPQLYLQRCFCRRLRKR
jgi:hypothetical protein